MQKSFSDADLLEHIRNLPHARATYKQLIRELRIPGEKRNSLEEALERLAEKGSLIELRSGHYVAPGANPEYVSGRLSVHRDGFGFLIPEQASEGIKGDIFLPPDEASKGMHGDRALAHITRFREDGRADGEIIRILGRAHVTVVGEFRSRKRGNFVAPSDDRIQQWIRIPEGMELPIHNPSVDRVGAEPLPIASAEDLDGMIVNVEVLEFPKGGDEGVGRVIEVLGYPDEFGVDVEIIIRKHHLPHAFPQEALEEAQGIAQEIDGGELGRRRDFRHLDIVTIDGETARDFDDAVWVERTANGRFALQVHIADVSHYVKPGSPIDNEALLRGT
ncbi:MAG: RNB domain-containing ribonuclease, partial [Acidobacteriaceae bacterium]|nr:RNB domain-containing ribonuclease [Acidobacteriaceae bacterium]MBV9296543.1 RNB domain-containing ribonuclease [Acidobacteriaceae bacterium]